MPVRHLLAVFCLALIAPIAWAAPAPSAPKKPADIAAHAPPEEIVIVRGEPRRRASSPVSATVIVDPQTAAIDDLVTAVPGLSMINDQDPGANIIALRGVTSDRLQQAAIAYVVDGAPLADTDLFTAKLFDIARIDVLRGPQGALFGKNAAGGAIEVTSATGRGGADAYARAGIGNGQARSLEAAGGAGGDGWSLRAAGLWTAHAGWIKNRTLGRVVDREDSRNARLTLSRVAGPLTLTGRLRWMEESGGAAWASSGNVTGRFGGRLTGAALTDPIGDFEGRSWRRWLQGALTAEAKTDAGDVTLILARDSYAKRWQEELDYRPGPLTFFGAPLFPNGLQPIRQPTDIRAETADLNWRRDLGRATLKLGLFAQNVARTRVDDFGPLLFGAPAARYDSDAEQRAAYAAFTYAWERATLDIQARYDRDARRQIISAAGAQVESRRATFERFQPRIAGSVALGENIWAYANYGEGFRSGGFNPIPAPSSVWRAQFAPEITRSGELGVKGRLGAGRFVLQVDANLFRSDISNYQNYTFLDAQSVTLNVGSVRVDGAELFFALTGLQRGRDAFDLRGGFALANARIGRFIAPDPLIASAQRDYTGARVPNAPQWTATAGLDWRRDMASGDIGANLTLNATGKTFYEIDNALRSPPKTWLDARLWLQRQPRSFDGRHADPWRVSVWGRNITDERWAISAFGQGMLPLLAGLGPDGPFDTFTLNRGRQWGVELSRTFR
ncbi:MAG: TonB-dependent receptor [Caulobacterales bacterium]